MYDYEEDLNTQSQEDLNTQSQENKDGKEFALCVAERAQNKTSTKDTN